MVIFTLIIQMILSLDFINCEHVIFFLTYQTDVLKRKKCEYVSINYCHLKNYKEDEIEGREVGEK